MGDYWSAHTHSRFSANDALSDVKALVGRAYELDMPALGLTDHGTMGGVYQLYRECRARDMMAVPGIEAYVSDNRHVKRPTTRHMGLLATTTRGFQNLVGLNNHMMASFKYKPLVDLDDLARFSRLGMLDGVHVITGCFFGWLPRTLMDAGEPAARNLLVALRDLFDGRVYVELQNHRIDEQGHSDADLVSDLFNLAGSVGLPVVVTNDAHYTWPKQVGMHNALKFMASVFGAPDDAIFPGDGYWLCSENTMRRRFDEQVWDAGVAGLQQMLSGYDLRIESIDSYRPRIPMRGGGDADSLVRDKCEAALAPMTGVRSKRFRARLEEELAVVRTTGFAPYLLLVESITDRMRSEGIAYNTRGSASGSLVCYLLGITQVDPVAHGLMFERFLAVDRKSSPDIDLDVQHDRRKEVVDWMSDTYACAQIGTWGRLGYDENTGKGSLIVKWNAAAKKSQRRAEPPLEVLRDLSDAEPYASTGTHAGGILMVESERDFEFIPMQRAGGSTVTALVDKDLEASGYTKVDVLGSKTLSAVVNGFSQIGVDMDSVGFTDPKVYSRIGTGKLTGTFQLSGWTSSKGCRRMKPKTFNELVHVMALFRPAAMNSGATDLYLDRRRHGYKVEYDNPVVEKHLSSTRGVLLFQEQLIGVLRDIGVEPVLLSKVLKAVKASNSAIGGARGVMDDAVALVMPMARANGFTDAGIEWLALAMRSYAEYGFNLAHSVSYARVSYLSVWLLVHHPAVFYAQSLSAHDGDQKFKQEMISAMADDKSVVMLPVHVNHSGSTYRADGRAVVFALTDVNGLGVAAAEEIEAKAPFTSVADLAARCDARKVTGAKAFLKGATAKEAGGVITKLYESSALDGLREHPLGEKKEKGKK